MGTNGAINTSTISNSGSTINTLNSQNGLKSAPRTSLNTGYSRYDQEIFQKEPIADFQIETGLSFHGIFLFCSFNFKNILKFF